MVTDGIVSSGDMLLGQYTTLKEDIERYEASQKAGANNFETQAAITGEYCFIRWILCRETHGRKWENGIVYWEYPDLNLSEREQVLRIIREYERRTDLRFVNRSTGSRIVFKKDNDGCYSWLGRTGVGPQTLNLSAADGCFQDAVIRHEIGHAIGLIHEHQRRDRNDHIQVFTRNIESDQRSQFQRIKRRMEVQTPYDTNSIMHYGSNVFSIGAGDRNPTMTTIGNFIIEYNFDLTGNDVNAINSYF